MVVAGLNTDIIVGSIRYHIQTEDWGSNKSCIVTQVFSGGQSIRQIKVMYEQLFNKNNSPQLNEIEQALEVQHNKVIQFIETRKIE